MTRPFVVVATPCFGGLVTQDYMLSVMRLKDHAGSAGYDLDVLLLGGDSLIGRARSVLVAHMLANPRATHLLFVDADIGFAPAAVDRLLGADVDFAAGLYPIKQVDWSQVPARHLQGEPLDVAGLAYVGTPCEGAALQVRDGFATGLYAGGGFQLIRRGVFERMIAAYPDLRFRRVHVASGRPPPPEHLCALFDSTIDPDTGAYVSEDYAFCQRWRAIGGTLWLDLTSTLTHAQIRGDARARFAALLAAGDRPGG